MKACHSSVPVGPNVASSWWKIGCGSLTIVNTGALTGPLGAYLVDVIGDGVAVHRLKLRHGHWQSGHLVAEIPLQPI